LPAGWAGFVAAAAFALFAGCDSTDDKAVI
jgi:hypothetical protein